MPALRRPAVFTGAAALGHGLIFVGFLQPWVAGQFGARERLSGLDLARLTDNLIDHGLAGDALTLPITRIVLLMVPIAAANALLMLGLGRVGLIAPAHGDRFALVLAIPAAFVGLISLALIVLAAGEAGGVVDGPAFGVLLVTFGAAAPLASWFSQRPDRDRPRHVREPATPEA